MIVSTLDRDPEVPLPVSLAQPEVSLATTCRCGHQKDAHEHFRSGSDCGACDCTRYRRPRRR